MKQLSLFEVDEIPHTGSKKTKIHHWRVYIDGASRNNPGKSGAGIVIYCDDKRHEKKGYYLGIRTNNQAEYFALLLGIYLVKKAMAPGELVTIISDSQLLVRQFKGEYKVKHPELKPLHEMARKELDGVSCQMKHVMREENSEADEMANDGIDTMKRPPVGFMQLLQDYGIQ